MSDLSSLTECREWLAAWLAEPNGLRRVAHAAREQRRNLDRAQTFSTARKAEYTQSVELLERVTRENEAKCTCLECENGRSR